MGVLLKRIYLKNYKLFEKREVEFSKGLSVFDGPNGYGKTSIFDAIELLITGTIRRIEDSESIAGNKSYESNFLARNHNQDVVIMGEFALENGKDITIALRIPKLIPEYNRTNNPKDTIKSAKMYIVNNYDPEHIEWDRELSEAEVKELRDMLFGSQNIEFFKNFHYVQQEDRLGYFKQSEKTRLEEIHKLFGIDKDEEKYAKVEKLYNQVKGRISNLSKNIVTMTSNIEGIRKNVEANAEYVAIAGGNPIWDKRDIGFKGADSKPTYERYLDELIRLNSLAEFKDEYLKSRDIGSFERIPLEIRASAIRVWALDKQDPEILNRSYAAYQNVAFLKGQLALAEQHKFASINYDKMLCILNMPNENLEAKNILNRLNNAQKNQTSLQSAISDLIQIRNNLFKHTHSIEKFSNKKCPYCGYTWASDEDLRLKFTETEKFITETVEGENSAVKKATDELIRLFNDNCFAKMQEYIESYNNDSVLKMFNQNSLSKLREWKLLCAPVLTRIDKYSEISLARSVDKYSFEGYAEIATEKIEEIKSGLSEEFLSVRNINDFDSLYKNYFEGNDYLSKLDGQKIKLKKFYIQNQYEASYDNTFKELEKLKTQLSEMEELQWQLSQYKDKLKAAINRYQLQVIKQIEIPFFLYSSRLLQSYQAGQGVMISSTGSSIRFTVPGKDHDVLYTMSSGQMSAVLLSFSLALNKIYAGEKFRTLFIDDPIQCMDDINMVSFVDLLRQEFSDSQIIMSTHEDTFSNFIKYKFDKFKKENKSINLRS